MKNAINSWSVKLIGQIITGSNTAKNVANQTDFQLPNNQCITTGDHVLLGYSNHHVNYSNRTLITNIHPYQVHFYNSTIAYYSALSSSTNTAWSAVHK